MSINDLTVSIYNYLKEKNGNFIPVRLPNRGFDITIREEDLQEICDELNTDPFIVAINQEEVTPKDGLLLRLLGIGLIQFSLGDEFSIYETEPQPTAELDFLDELL